VGPPFGGPYFWGVYKSVQITPKLLRTMACRRHLTRQRIRRKSNPAPSSIPPDKLFRRISRSGARHDIRKYQRTPANRNDRKTISRTIQIFHRKHPGWKPHLHSLRIALNLHRISRNGLRTIQMNGQVSRSRVGPIRQNAHPYQKDPQPRPHAFTLPVPTRHPRCSRIILPIQFRAPPLARGQNR
jgi:hypothetical protein